MANALTFIESNIEDLDVDQRIEKIRSSLEEQINLMVAKYSMFAPFKQQLMSRKHEIQDLLYQMLIKSDKKALDLIGNDPVNFIKQLEQNEASLGKGMRWDELVLRIEWSCETKLLLQRKDLSKAQIEAISKLSSEMQFCFNTHTIDRWLARLKENASIDEKSLFADL